MNCKPGDLAVIVSAPNRAALGLFVNVIELDGGVSANARHLGSPLWVIEASGGAIPCGKNGKPHKRVTAPDSALRPIRNPGEDARDETLEWLPVPIKETEVA